LAVLNYVMGKLFHGGRGRQSACRHQRDGHADQEEKRRRYETFTA
jgi:hypothetical protein